MANKTTVKSTKNLTELLNEGKCMDDYKKALELNLKGMTIRNSYNYINHGSCICESNISTHEKKILLSTLHKMGVNVCGSRSGEDQAMKCAIVQKDLVLLKFLHTKFKASFPYPTLGGLYEQLACVHDNNEFIINLIIKYDLSTMIKKSFLRGAISTSNITLMKYFVEDLKLPLFMATHTCTAIHSLGQGIAKSNNMSTLKYLESHGYNIHECRRLLLNNVYSYGHTEMMDYILQKQEKCEDKDEYMENVSNIAYNKQDINFLTKYPNIGLHVNIGMITQAADNRNLVFVQVLTNRYVKQEINKRLRYMNPQSAYYDRRIDVIGRTSMRQLYAHAKDDPLIWEYLQKMIITYGTEWAVKAFLRNKKLMKNDEIDTLVLPDQPIAIEYRARKAREKQESIKQKEERVNREREKAQREILQKEAQAKSKTVPPKNTFYESSSDSEELEKDLEVMMEQMRRKKIQKLDAEAKQNIQEYKTVLENLKTAAKKAKDSIQAVSSFTNLPINNQDEDPDSIEKISIAQLSSQDYEYSSEEEYNSNIDGSYEFIEEEEEDSIDLNDCIQ